MSTDFDFGALDFSKVKTNNNFEPVPVGEYTVISDDAELKSTKDGTGAYVSLKLKIIGGDHDGRFIFNTFNVQNKSEKATEIGLSQLKSYMQCCGIKDDKLKNVIALVGYKCKAIVKQKTDSFGTKAVVSYFKPLAKDDVTQATTTPKRGSDGLW